MAFDTKLNSSTILIFSLKFQSLIPHDTFLATQGNEGGAHIMSGNSEEAGESGESGESRESEGHRQPDRK